MQKNCQKTWFFNSFYVCFATVGDSRGALAQGAPRRTSKHAKKASKMTSKFSEKSSKKETKNR